MRRYALVTILVIIMILTIQGIAPGISAIKKAIGIREILRAREGMAFEEINNPFVCLRKPGNPKEINTELFNGDMYLQGVTECLSGDYDAGLASLSKSNENLFERVQYAARLSELDPQAGVNLLASLELNNDDLVLVLQKIIEQENVEPFPALRLLARKAGDEIKTWELWLQGSSRFENIGKWNDAINWINEGLEKAPTKVLSSLYLRIGQIYLQQGDKSDFYNALSSYNQAIELDMWIYYDDKITAHILRGVVYRSLQDEFGLQTALEDFNYAIKLDPNNYFATYEIGNLYFYGLKDLDQAETYYRKAIIINSQYPYAYFYLGEVYRARGDYIVAAEWYQQAFERDPDWQAVIDRLKEIEGK